MIYKAVGRPDVLNLLSFVKLVMLVPVLWWGAANYGILGVAWGQLVVRAIGILIDMWAVSGFVKVSVLHNLRVIWPPLFAAAVMAAAVQALFTFAQMPSGIPALVAAIASGAAIYASLIWLLDPKSVSALTSLALGMVRRRRAASEA